MVLQLANQTAKRRIGAASNFHFVIPSPRKRALAAIVAVSPTPVLIMAK